MNEQIYCDVRISDLTLECFRQADSVAIVVRSGNNGIGILLPPSEARRLAAQLNAELSSPLTTPRA